MTPPLAPQGFWSYVRSDDAIERGRLSRLRERLEGEIRIQLGHQASIFQDLHDIRAGQDWQRRLTELLNASGFFIPILTPSYFTSAACREEAAFFIDRMSRLGRDDLVFPLYYLRVGGLHDEAAAATDPLLAALKRPNWMDWRDLRFAHDDSSVVGQRIEKFAGDIIDALRRARGGTASPPAAAPPVQRQDLDIFRDRLKDGADGPEMVVIPAGSFLMGSPESDKEADADEKPQRLVRIGRRFALGRYPVTFAEYDRFCAATRRALPFDMLWGRGLRPAIHVSWGDATAYCVWLSGETGARYRLPSESEWKYACRAGTTTRYWWGDALNDGPAVGGAGVIATMEVDDSRANPWRLGDVLGNVWEWCADHWEADASKLPTDGTAHVVTGAASKAPRVGRGGSWLLGPRFLRCAYRIRLEADNRFNLGGFRLARTL